MKFRDIRPLTLITKLQNSLRQEGLRTTLLKCARYPTNRLKYRRYDHALEGGSPTDIFTKIYEMNFWSDKSVSGSGSTLESTENLRHNLPMLFKEFSIRLVFDAPCGDFNWMQYVVSSSGIQYLGADIVPILVEKNCERFRNANVEFAIRNISTDQFPDADLWICRDCLFHLSYKDIYQAWERFSDSKIPFVLTTTHINTSNFENVDIPTGHYRKIDLFREPFQLSKDVRLRISDWVAPAAPREMCLWTREQIATALRRMRPKIAL